jgi:hypothetical protein
MGKAIGRGVIPFAISKPPGTQRGVRGPNPANGFENRFGLRFQHFGLAVLSQSSSISCNSLI